MTIDNKTLESEGEVRFVMNNIRNVTLHYHLLSSIKEDKNENNEIVSVTIGDRKFSLGDIIKINAIKNREIPFKINKIEKGITYTFYSSVLTKASRLIFPMLKVTKENKDYFRYKENFINCYVGTIDTGYMDSIYLVYRFIPTAEYLKFEKNLQKHPLYDRTIDLDNYHVMYVFNMTDRQKKIFELFKKGKYSKFPDDYKKTVLSFNIGNQLLSTEDIYRTITYGILYKTKLQKKRIEDKIDLKLSEKQEYYSIPIEKEEVYNGDIEINIVKDNFDEE